MSWYYQGQLVEALPEDCVGFVYLITNLSSGRLYVGKKLAKFSKTTYRMVKLKNGTKKKKKIRGTIESDWREYYGSSEALHQDLKTLGADQFKREILYYCKSKAEASYLEAREQFERRVLESDDYYNGIINVRVGGSKVLRQALQEQRNGKL
jgi:Putative endonuclease segE, GIY-YIG domain